MPAGSEPRPGRWALAVAGAVAELMDAADVTQDALGERAGVHPSTVSRCLTGKRSFTLDEVARVAGALGLSPTVVVLRAQVRLGESVTDDPAGPVVEGAGHAGRVSAPRTARPAP